MEVTLVVQPSPVVVDAHYSSSRKAFDPRYFDLGGLGFEFCVFVAGWRHALRSEWPFIIIISP